MSHMEMQKEIEDLVDSAWYLAMNCDVDRYNIPAARHFFELGMMEGRNPNYFMDQKWYHEQYLRKTQINAVYHFVSQGWRAGYNPSTSFDCSWYLAKYPEVERSGVNPLIHYIKAGRAAGFARSQRQYDFFQVQRSILEGALKKWRLAEPQLETDLRPLENIEVLESPVQTPEYTLFKRLVNLINSPPSVIVVVDSCASELLPLHLEALDISPLVIATGDDRPPRSGLLSSWLAMGPRGGDVTFCLRGKVLERLIWALRPTRVINIDSSEFWNFIDVGGAASAGTTSLETFLTDSYSSLCRAEQLGNLFRRFYCLDSCLPAVRSYFLRPDHLRKVIAVSPK